MKIIQVTEVIEDCLYSILWAGEQADSLEKMVNELSDTKFLFDFFTANEAFLKSGYYTETNLHKAIRKIRNEFQELIGEIYRRAKSGPDEPLDTLERLFEPLDGRQRSPNFRQGKAKVHQFRQPMLRIYGIKEDSNRIIITGYAIKLTEWMDDHENTKKEKMKVQFADKWLEDNEWY